MGLNLKGISHPHPSSAVSFGPICGLVIYRRSYATNEPILGFVDTNMGYLHLISGRSDIWSDLSIRDGVLMSSGSGAYWGGVSAILIGMTL